MTLFSLEMMIRFVGIGYILLINMNYRLFIDIFEYADKEDDLGELFGYDSIISVG